jgi:hypothetical protein
VRDIRSDLRERLDAIAKRKVQLKAEAESLDQEEIAVQGLIQREDQRFGVRTSQLVLTSPELNQSANGFGRTPLSRLILNILKQNNHALGLDDFKKFAADLGFDFGEQSPGRTLHWALVGLTQSGHLECFGQDRKYRLARTEATEKVNDSKSERATDGQPAHVH